MGNCLSCIHSWTPPKYVYIGVHAFDFMYSGFVWQYVIHGEQNERLLPQSRQHVYSYAYQGLGYGAPCGITATIHRIRTMSCSDLTLYLHTKLHRCQSPKCVFEKQARTQTTSYAYMPKQPGAVQTSIVGDALHVFLCFRNATY